MSNVHPIVGKQQYERLVACIKRNTKYFDDYASKELIEIKEATPPASKSRKQKNIFEEIISWKNKF